MADILVTGKKISDMDLATEINGDEKIPTGSAGDVAITPDQLVEYTRRNTNTSWGKIVGDIDDQLDLKNKFLQASSSLSSHVNNKENPHEVTKAQIGLGNVDNTSDANKPVSNATQVVLETKADKTNFNNLIDDVKTGSILEFDQSFANSIGGYPLNARIMLGNGAIVQNKIANNTNNPNTDMAGWSLLADSQITTWSGRSQESKNKDIVHAKDFGFTSDALITAFMSSNSIYLGDKSCTYSLDKEVSVTLNSDLYIYSNGAKVTAINKMRSMFRINANGYSVFIDGLKLDANMLAFTGLYIQTNETTVDTQALISKIEVKNCRRADTSFTGGDGVYITGGFTSVDINRLDIDGVYLAAGSGVSGTQGVSGVTVIRAEQVIVSRFNIANVITEDLSYTYDQDAVRIFTKHSQDSVLPTKTVSTVKNGVIRDIPGRAVKSQCELIEVENVTVYNDSKNFTRGYGNAMFDFQTGGGTLRNCTAVLKDFVPQGFVYIYSSGSIIKNTGMNLGTVDGLTISVEMTSAKIQDDPIIRIAPAQGADYDLVTLKNIKVRGANYKVSHFINVSGAYTDEKPSNLTIKAEDCVLPVANYLLNAVSTYTERNLRAILKNIINSSENSVSMIDETVANNKGRWASVDVENLVGINAATVGNLSLSNNFINGRKEYSEFPLVGDRRGGGSIRANKLRLDLGTTSYDLKGYAHYTTGNFSNLVLLTISNSMNSIILLATEANNCKALTNSSAISVGGSAPSTTPLSFDVWVENNVLKISNTTGVRFATIEVIG